MKNIPFDYDLKYDGSRLKVKWYRSYKNGWDYSSSYENINVKSPLRNDGAICFHFDSFVSKKMQIWNLSLYRRSYELS